MRIDRLPVADGSVFLLVGTLDAAGCGQVEHMLAGAVSGGEVVTLDLSELQSCDNAGADMLVELTQRARIAHGCLILTSVPDAVLRSFVVSDAVSKLHIIPEPVARERRWTSAPRYLFRAGEAAPFAYASSRHDFTRLGEDQVWAHQSHDWLLEAGSGKPLAHRTRGAYFSPDSGECLYTEQPTDLAGR